MDFLTFLEKYDRQDVSKVKKIIEANKQKEETILSEAFRGEYPSKKEAIFVLEQYFVSKDTAPAGVDVSYAKKHLTALKHKIESLSEGDIRIIIHNHEGKKDGSSPMEYEEEGMELSKKKRGRPNKTGVVYYDPREVIADEPPVLPKSGEPVKATVAIIKDDGKGEEEGGDSALVTDASDELIEELSTFGLTEEDLKQATDMAEAGVIDETDDSKIARAARIISKINQLE